MAYLSPHRKIILQSVLAFILGSQLTHIYLNPLRDIDDLVAAKKSELWASYLKDKVSPQNGQTRMDTYGVEPRGDERVSTQGGR
jgi:hypothetical protein